MQLENNPNDTSAFLDSIFGVQEGFFKLGCKAPDFFNEVFFKWPSQKPEGIAWIDSMKAEGEVYIGPAILSSENSTKAAVSSSSVVWCEFDGEIPTDLDGFPEPSIRVRSSGVGREHWYWILNQPIAPDRLEGINRAISFKFDADHSGWDSTQYLRPPNTFNHKRKAKVELISSTGASYSPSQLGNLPAPPPIENAPEIASLPHLGVVCKTYTWPEKAWALFEKGVEVGSRSDGLVALAYYLAEMQMANEEMFVVLIDADSRWGKFSERKDRDKRLMDIISKARIKYPKHLSVAGIENGLVGYGFTDLLNLDIHLEWVIEGLLHKEGFLLLTGPSGVGKTQFSLNMAQHLVLGKDYCGYTINNKHRIGFFSLEMGIPDLKYFCGIQADSWSDEEKQELNQNFVLYPLGEPLYLNREVERKKIELLQETFKLDGIIVDSLGSVTEESLSNNEANKPVLDWVDRFRNRTGCFVEFIHHHRKASGENRKPKHLPDVYGDQYLTARATSVVCLWPTNDNSKVELIDLKIRLAPNQPSRKLYRNSNLHFSLTQSAEDALTDEIVEAALIQVEELQTNFIEKESSAGGGSASL